MNEKEKVLKEIVVEQALEIGNLRFEVDAYKSSKEQGLLLINSLANTRDANENKIRDLELKAAGVKSVCDRLEREVANVLDDCNDAQKTIKHLDTVVGDQAQKIIIQNEDLESRRKQLHVALSARDRALKGAEHWEGKAADYAMTIAKQAREFDELKAKLARTEEDLKGLTQVHNRQLGTITSLRHSIDTQCAELDVRAQQIEMSMTVQRDLLRKNESLQEALHRSRENVQSLRSKL